MEFEIEIPDKYAQKLEDVEEVEPNIKDQIEVEVLPEVLGLINDAHRQEFVKSQINQRGISHRGDSVDGRPNRSFGRYGSRA